MDIHIVAPEIKCLRCGNAAPLTPRELRLVGGHAIDGFTAVDSNGREWSVCASERPAGWLAMQGEKALCPTCAAEWRERAAGFLPGAELPLPAMAEAPHAALAAPTGLSSNGMSGNRAPVPSYGNVRAEPTPVKHVASNVSAIPSSIAPPSRVTPSMVSTVSNQNRVSPNVQAPTVQHTKTRVETIHHAKKPDSTVIPPPAGGPDRDPKVTGAVVPERASRVSPVAPPAGVVKTLSS